MKTAKTIEERIEMIEFKLKWYQTSVNLLTSHIAMLKLQRDKGESKKQSRSHHGFNMLGEKY
jgi:hypothetical protein